MSRYILAIVALLATLMASAWTRNDLHDLNLKGPVKTLVYLSGNDTSSIRYFDIHGNAVKIVRYKDGQPESMSLFTHSYNVSGKLLSTVSDSNRMEYIYDKAGNLVQANNYVLSSGSLTERTVFKKGHIGQDSLMLEYGSKGELINKLFVETWDAGRIQMFWRYMDNGKVVIRNDYIYDASHNVEQHYSFDNFEQQEVETTTDYTYWSYDDRDNWAKCKHHVYRKISGMNRVDDWDESVTRWIEYY